MGSPLSPGTKLRRYEIRSHIGAGGMGEVYLAQDTRLERTVALKILPASVAADRQRMLRFIQEAKAASGLNHPNILTIHEIEQIDSVHLIATEFIDGETLRLHLNARLMGVAETLDISVQIASALSAAHAAGIIHRDIKPENIMLRRDGIVKVLDFGLAKLCERVDSEEETNEEAATKVLVQTEPGVVMGTAAYMSPEQARGLAVDARTDIFSLGVVVYEMVAGQAPFGGATKSDLIVALLEREPPPLARYKPEAPAELERLVTKTLAKDRDERYQTAKDLLIDLKRLKQKLAVEAEIERTAPPELRSAMGEAMPSGEQKAVSPQQVSATQTATVKSARTASSAEYIITEVKRHKIGLAVALTAIFLLSVAGVAYFFYFARRIDSIVVLPLANTSGDPNTEYLSDGISEALINSLTELHRLKVIARSTSFRYKGKEVDPRQVGRELNVRAVLMGRVRQRGDTLNIQVDLVDATTGAQFWGKEYDGKIADLLTVKQEITREITDKLRLGLTGEEQKRLTARDTSNTAAYQSYLKGRYYWNKRTAENLQKAIDQFRRAADEDPNYALAYVGLADCYALLEEYADAPASETYPKAKALAERALQTDGSLAEAHASLALINLKLWRWDEAEREFKRAIELNPNYPTAHHWYNHFLRAVGRFDEALAEIKRAQELDPLSLVINVSLAKGYLIKGDVNSAVEQCKKVIELDPNFPTAHNHLGLAYLMQGRYPEGLAELQKAVELSGTPGAGLNVGYGYAVSGRRAEANAILKQLEEKYAKREAIGQDIAAVLTGLGDIDQAFAWLEKDFQAHSGLLMEVRWEPYFNSLRSDARYRDLLRRMGLTL